MIDKINYGDMEDKHRVMRKINEIVDVLNHHFKPYEKPKYKGERR